MRTVYTFYARPGFEETWKKLQAILKKEGKNVSQELRIWIEGYVHRHDPGNPQRPLTAYVPGSKDHDAMISGGLRQELRRVATNYGGSIPMWRILRELKDRGVPPRRRAAAAQSLAKQLHKAGVQVLR